VKVTRTVAGAITVLALAGAIATAALIFAVGLTVLWPALIACACLAAVGVVAFLIAHRNIQRKWERSIEGYVTFLSKMDKNTPILDAIQMLAKARNIFLHEESARELKIFISTIVNGKIKANHRGIETLNDLFEAKENSILNEITYYFVMYDGGLFPILVAILSLLSNSWFFIRKEDGNNDLLVDTYLILSCPINVKHNNNKIHNLCKNSICSICNHENVGDFAMKFATLLTTANMGKNRVFVSHYDGSGKLVIDP
jgi:hypothetical protein